MPYRASFCFKRTTSKCVPRNSRGGSEFPRDGQRGSNRGAGARSPLGLVVASSRPGRGAWGAGHPNPGVGRSAAAGRRPSSRRCPTGRRDKAGPGRGGRAAQQPAGAGRGPCVVPGSRRRAACPQSPHSPPSWPRGLQTPCRPRGRPRLGLWG